MLKFREEMEKLFVELMPLLIDASVELKTKSGNEATEWLDKEVDKLSQMTKEKVAQIMVNDFTIEGFVEFLADGDVSSDFKDLIFELVKKTFDGMHGGINNTNDFMRIVTEAAKYGHKIAVIQRVPGKVKQDGTELNVLDMISSGSAEVAVLIEPNESAELNVDVDNLILN